MPYVGKNAASFTTVVDVTVSDDLTVTDDATIGGALSVTGTTTSTGKITADAGIDIDTFNIDAHTISHTGGEDMILDSAARIVLDADDNGEITFKDNSVHYGQLKKDGDHLRLQSVISDANINFVGLDGSSEITALYLDMSEAGKAIFNAGVALGGTGAANTLDDYEEGTWTPTLGGNESYNARSGTYIKIGQKVTVWYNQAINAIGTGNPKLTSGLPFTVLNNSTQNVNGSQISYFTNVNTNVVSLSACPRQNTSTIRYAMMAAAGVNTTVNTDIFKNSTDVYAHATYYTA